MKVIKRVDVWSLAKLQAAVAFVMGLIIGLIQWLAVVLFGGLFQTLTVGLPAKLSTDMNATTGPIMINAHFPGLGTFAGVGFIGLVFFAVVAAIIGFVGGAITAAVYNFIAPRAGGGIKIDLADEEA